MQDYYEIHVQEFKRKKWRTVSVHTDLIEATAVADQRALRTLEPTRLFRIDYSLIKSFHYA